MRLELLHHILPHRPHTSPLPVYVHGYRGEQARNLYASHRQEHFLRAVGLEPTGEEEGEDEAVENVYWHSR